MSEPAGPTVTVVMVTRDRPETAPRAVRSLLANREPAFELVIVDQSKGAATETALAAFLADPRVRYRRSARQGLAAGRNEGIAHGLGRIIAMTDDDCEVPADWVARMDAVVASDARIALVFGNVLPGPHDAEAGYVPAYVRTEPVVAECMSQKHLIDGMGACMGLTRAAWSALGGFDEQLGPGAAFQAADDGDIAIRALAAGWCVLETPEVWVVHHGFRAHAEGSTLIGQYAFGAGAAIAKHLRCRTPYAPKLLADMAFRWSRGHVHPASRIGRRRHRLLRLVSFARGFAAGARAPLDRGTRRFVAPPRAAGAAR